MEIYFLPLQKTDESDFVVDSLQHIDYVDVYRLTSHLVAFSVDHNFDFYYEHSFSTLLEMLLSDGQISQLFFGTTVLSHNQFSNTLLMANTWTNMKLNFSAVTFEQFIFPLASNQSVKDSIYNLLGDTLIETILAFLKNNLNVLQTSKQMFIHRNTLNYRLAMIQQQTGINLRTFHGAVFFFTLLNN